MTAVLSVLLTLASVVLQARIFLTYRHPTPAEDGGSQPKETETSAP